MRFIIDLIVEKLRLMEKVCAISWETFSMVILYPQELELLMVKDFGVCKGL